MAPHEFADALHRAAVTLENDGDLYKSLPNYKLRRNQREVLWGRLGELDPTLRGSLQGYDGPCAVENLRRYLVDVWDIDTATEEEQAYQSYAKQPTIEFWKPEVREPPKKKAPKSAFSVNDLADYRSLEERTLAALRSQAFDYSAHLSSLTDQLNKLNSLTQKETTMSKPIEVTTKTLVNGIDVSTLTNAQVFDLIAEQEAAIKKLEAIDAKPKLLVKEIEDRKAGIAALVSYLDSQVK